MVLFAVETKDKDGKEKKRRPEDDFVPASVMAPLSNCPLPNNASELWDSVGLTSNLRALATEIAILLSLSSPSENPLFHRPVDIFKFADKNDLPQAVAAHSVTWFRVCR